MLLQLEKHMLMYLKVRELTLNTGTSIVLKKSDVAIL